MKTINVAAAAVGAALLLAGCEIRQADASEEAAADPAAEAPASVPVESAAAPATGETAEAGEETRAPLADMAGASPIETAEDAKGAPAK
ncbi:MAG: hypothetical protein AAFW97_00045 [Pseudomonadota bacterium]